MGDDGRRDRRLASADGPVITDATASWSGNIRVALRASERVHVLSTGLALIEGRARDLLDAEAVRKPYFG